MTFSEAQMAAVCGVGASSRTPTVRRALVGLAASAIAQTVGGEA